MAKLITSVFDAGHTRHAGVSFLCLCAMCPNAGHAILPKCFVQNLVNEKRQGAIGSGLIREDGRKEEWARLEVALKLKGKGGESGQ